MVQSARAFEAALTRKGFRLERRTRDKIFYLYHLGRKTQVWTKISEGRGEDLRNTLLGKIKQQMHFDTTSQVSEFIECSIDGPGYVRFLQGKSVLAPDS